MTELFAPPAAVVGGSVVSFASGLPPSHREDVYMSTAFAQNATRAAFEAGLSGEWFEYYCNQLRFLGWDVPRPQAFVPEQGGVMAGPLYNGQDYLGDDPDPNIRAYLLKDQTRYYGAH